LSMQARPSAIIYLTNTIRAPNRVLKNSCSDQIFQFPRRISEVPGRFQGFSRYLKALDGTLRRARDGFKA
jgi:hypothetical protein